jgi:hypothetical protein
MLRTGPLGLPLNICVMKKGTFVIF